MSTRVVTGGIAPIPGATQSEKRLYAERELEGLRHLLMFEPRGHSAMSGAILTEPSDPRADWGVVFIEVTGFLPMCGHGTIGVATTLVEAGMVEVQEPETTIVLDTPAGLVTANVRVEDGRACSVTIQNVPAFVETRDLTVEVPHRGPITLDIAYGGNFYAIVPAAALNLRVDPANAEQLLDAGMPLLDAINVAYEPVHPETSAIRGCHHVILTDNPSPQGAAAGASGHSCVVIHPGWLDRSPCGTGTSARMALLHDRGELPLDQPYVHEGLLGTCFIGRLVEETDVAGRPAVVPTITGRAFVTGFHQFLVDPADPFPTGFLL
jgi:proline racemase